MGHRMRKHSKIVGQRHLLRFEAHSRGAVGQRNDFEATFVRAAHGRFNAAIGQEAAQYDGANTAVSQDEIEVGARKGVQAALAFYDDIALTRRHDIGDGGTPRSFAEGLVLDHTFQDPVGMTVQLAVAFGKADWDVHDRDAGSARA